MQPARDCGWVNLGSNPSCKNKLGAQTWVKWIFKIDQPTTYRVEEAGTSQWFGTTGEGFDSPDSDIGTI
jgi:hypothetical protein